MELRWEITARPAEVALVFRRVGTEGVRIRLWGERAARVRASTKRAAKAQGAFVPRSREWTWPVSTGDLEATIGEGQQPVAGQGPLLTLARSADGIASATLSLDRGPADRISPPELLAALLAHPDAASMRQLTLGLTRSEGWSGSRDLSLQTAVLGASWHGTLAHLSLRGAHRRVCDEDGKEDDFASSFVELGQVTPIFAAFPALRSLSLAGTRLRLQRTSHPRLEVLELDLEAFGPDLLGALAASEFPSLTRLHLDFGARRGFIAYAPSALFDALRRAPFPALETLALRGIDDGDRLAQALARIPTLRGLRRLDLVDTTLSPDGQTALARALPATEIVR